MSDWYDIVNKQPVPMEDMNLYERRRESDDWIVGKTTIHDPIRETDIEVSTVFLFLDHGWGGKSLLFETLVFDAADTPMANYQVRYHTWEEAEKGHEETVAAVEAMFTAPSV